jgi:hypothetical protein
VEGSIEQACSWVVATDKLLWETMALVSWDILHPMQVSLKKGKSLSEFL